MRSWEQHFPSHGEVHDDNFRLAPLSDHSSPPGTAMTTAESESADEVLMVPSLVEESHKKKNLDLRPLLIIHPTRPFQRRHTFCTQQQLNCKSENYVVAIIPLHFTQGAKLRKCHVANIGDFLQ